MARRSALLPLAGAALAILGVLAWWVLSPTSGPVAGTGQAETRTPKKREAGTDVQGKSPTERPGEPEAAGGGGSGPWTAPKPEGDEEEMRTGVAVLQTGQPLAGVEVVQDFDVEIANLPLIADPLPVSDTEGRFQFWKTVSLKVLHPYADLVSVENGEMESPPPGARVRTVRPGDGPLRLVFRDRPGLAFVLLRDGVTGAAITDLTGVRIEWRVPDGRRWRHDFAKDNGHGGWIPMGEDGFTAELTPAPSPAEVKVEFSAPGYARRTVPQTDLKGRTELPLDPEPPDVKGVVRMHEVLPTLREPVVSSSLRRLSTEASGSAAGEVRGLPSDEGPFAIHDLPDGRWALEIAVDYDGFIARATREFEHWSGTTDLGEIEIRIGAGIRARLRDANGNPIPQADVVVVREEEEPTQARRLEPDADGWVVYGDLEPKTRHRVVVLGLSVPMEKVVTSPEKPGQVESVEFKFEGTVVDCAFRFTLDGRPLTRPTALKEAPIREARRQWEDDGLFRTALLPGPHRFSVEVVHEDGSPAGTYAAEVQVPSGDTFATTIELKAP